MLLFIFQSWIMSTFVFPRVYFILMFVFVFRSLFTTFIKVDLCMYFRDVFGDFLFACIFAFLLKACHLLGELG